MITVGTDPTHPGPTHPGPSGPTNPPPPPRVETCPKCGREWHPWPLVRPALCSPKRWAHCVRPLVAGFNLRLSATQVEALAYFAGERHPSVIAIRITGKAGGKPKETTYRMLVRAGLLEPVDAFPFHRTTEAGRRLIGGAR